MLCPVRARKSYSHAANIGRGIPALRGGGRRGGGAAGRTVGYHGVATVG